MYRFVPTKVRVFEDKVLNMGLFQYDTNELCWAVYCRCPQNSLSLMTHTIQVCY